MCTLLLIRHAAHDDLGSVLSGRRADIGLSEKGLAQAEALPGFLPARRLSALHTSPRRRAQQTARALARSLGARVEVHAALDELDYGEWTGRRFRDLDGDARWQRWNRERGAARPPRGESFAELRARMLRHVDEAALRHPGGMVALVSHAEPIRACLLDARGLPPEEWQRLDIAPASVTVLERRAGRWARVSQSQARAA